MSSLLQRELVFVTGKGGVGKTTVALALAIAGARAGRRTVLCEVGGQARAAAVFGRAPGAAGREVQLADGLWNLTADPVRALEEWAGHVIGSRRLAGVVARSNAFAGFVHAAPGARELLSIAKAWELGREERWVRPGQRYDLVVVDGPASGHGVGMLRTPRTFLEIARVGPIAHQAERIAALLEDPVRSGVLAVAQPAEMPVSETLDLEGRVHGALGRGLEAIVVNGLLPRRFTSAEIQALATRNGQVPAAVAGAARSQHGQAVAQQAQLRRLRRAASAPIHTLPFVSSPVLGREQVEELAGDLGRRVGG